MLLVMFLLGFLLLDSLIMLRRVYGENILLRWRRNWYISEFPHWRSWLPYRYLWIILWWGADLGFHLLRIEFLAQSLAQGIFPAE